MTPAQANQLDAVYKALFGPYNGPAGTQTPIGWKNIGGDVQTARYGLLPVVIHNQSLIASLSGKLAGVTAAVEQLAATGGGKIDLAAIEAAAEKGAKEALDGLVLRADG